MRGHGWCRVSSLHQPGLPTRCEHSHWLRGVWISHHSPYHCSTSYALYARVPFHHPNTGVFRIYLISLFKRQIV
jgi:hypothetical protein